MKKLLIIVLVNFIMSPVATVLAQGKNTHKPLALVSEANTATQEDIEAGRKLYEKRCTFCHGSEGRGDGVAAPHLDPKPRDFTSAQFKLRSTPSGELPTDEDIFRTITNGMPSTSMPAWDTLLSEKERWQLVSYIKTFSERFKKENPKQITVSKKIRATRKTIAHGKELYEKMKCFLCHGDEGRGDGPITERLRYEWSFPFKARNLTKASRFKGGKEIEDIYRAVSTGLNGTPMGSYSDYLSDEERWHIAHYVRTLSPQKEAEGQVVLKSKFTKDALPEEPSDPQWEKAEPVEIALGGQIIVRPQLWTPSIDSVTVRTLYNENQIAFLLEWADATNRQDEIFRDAVAIQFPVEIPDGPEKPYFLMGQRGKVVNIWQWKANFKEESDEGETDIEELNAAGFDKLTPQPLESQDLKGEGVWKDGRWKVVLTRPLITKDKDKDIRFERGKFIPIAFNVWDGSNFETGLRKSISAWYYLLLETRKPSNVYLYSFIVILLAVNFEFWLVPKLRKP